MFKTLAKNEHLVHATKRNKILLFSRSSCMLNTGSSSLPTEPVSLELQAWSFSFSGCFVAIKVILSSTYVC